MKNVHANVHFKVSVPGSIDLWHVKMIASEVNACFIYLIKVYRPRTRLKTKMSTVIKTQAFRQN